MPSRSFYHQTSDGFLEKGPLKTLEEIDTPPLQAITESPPEKNFDVDMNDGQDWFGDVGKSGIPDTAQDRISRRQSLVNSQEWQNILATHPFDNASNQVFLEDAPFELDDTIASMSALIDPDLGNSKLTMDAGYQDLTQRSYRGYSSLSISEERTLRDIAMPSYVLPDTPAIEGESPNSPKPETKVRRKKRKGSIASEGADTSYLHQTRKQGHNAIEKRYRTNLNDKIAALQQCLPSMRTPTKAEQVDRDAEEDEQPGSDAAQKSGKAAVLTGAVEYITQLEGNVTQLSSETTVLKARLAAFEKLVSSGSIVLSDPL